MNLENKDNSSMIIQYQNTDNVVEDICSIIESARNYAYQSVNIALVERKLKGEIDEKQYVVAFGYKITDNEITWDYGYYYYNNIEKAKHDFDKVIKGGNLAHTFDKGQERSR